MQRKHIYQCHPLQRSEEPDRNSAFEMAEAAAAGASGDLPMVNPPALYAPLLWPFLYVYEGIRSPDKLRVAKPISTSHLGLVENVLSFVASLRSFLMAYAVIYWLHDEESPYPAWGRGAFRISFNNCTQCIC